MDCRGRSLPPRWPRDYPFRLRSCCASARTGRNAEISVLTCVCVCVCVCVCKYVETLKLCCFGGSAAPLPSLLVDYFDVLLPQEEGASHGFRLDLFCSGKGEAWLPLPLAFRSPRCRFFFFFPMKTHSLPIGAFCSRSSQNLPYLSSAETF